MTADIYTLELAAPGKNALSSALMQSVLDRLAEADGRPLYVTGAGDAFSAGLNLKEVASLDAAGMAAFLRLLERTVDALYSYPGPSAAYVNGHAIAGGCVVALCCDYRVVRNGDDVKIGLNETALGLPFPPGVRLLAHRRLPPQHRDLVLLGAELVGPHEAARLGLVDVVADNGADLALGWLARIAQYPRSIYAKSKADFRGRLTVSDAENAVFFEQGLEAWTSPHMKARILAALKR